jgi:hypothetical protein
MGFFSSGGVLLISSDSRAVSFVGCVSESLASGMVGLRAFCALRVFVRVEAAVCAAENTEEKNPVWGVPSFPSSIVGLAAIEFDSLLGFGFTEEVDLTRR